MSSSLLILCASRGKGALEHIIRDTGRSHFPRVFHALCGLRLTKGEGWSITQVDPSAVSVSCEHCEKKRAFFCGEKKEVSS